MHTSTRRPRNTTEIYNSIRYRYFQEPMKNMAACTGIRRRRVSSVTAIFFDLDNTLIRTRKADKLACDKLTGVLQEQYDLQKDEALLASQSFLRNFRLCPENAEMNLEEWRHFLWARALGETHANISEEVASLWLQLRYQYLALIPEVKSLLNQLRDHYLLGLITNGPSRAQWEKVHMLNLQQYFDCILVSGDLPWEKPDENIFFQACRYLGVQPHNCIMVGDKLETDIAGGKQALLGGTVWIPLNQENSNGTCGPQPDFTLRNVTDLPTLLPSPPKQIARHARPDIEDTNSNASDGS